MDPALQELIKNTPDDQEIEAILKLRDAQYPPPGVRIISQFGKIATCRIPSDLIREIWASELVESLKASRLIGHSYDSLPEKLSGEAVRSQYQEDKLCVSREVTGKGAVVAFLDWGCDFAHPNFLNENGTTRLLALWDQSARTATSENRFGYGEIYTREAIDRALQSNTPYALLGYYPAESDRLGIGAHGTSVMDIAAGNGRVPTSPCGFAPKADLIFVQMASRGTFGLLRDLGDSVRLLEALDFVNETAGFRPWVANLSLGSMGGSHDGKSLVEQGMDALLSAAPGRAICQSTGNYFLSETHASGRLRPGRERQLGWIVDRADRTPNELEVWYSGDDIFLASLIPPNGSDIFQAALGEQTTIVLDDRKVGYLYHRARDPNNGKNHIDIFLYPEAPAGRWEVKLSAKDILDGSFNAWIERDFGRPENQSSFDPADVITDSTTGTICNGFNTIAVGAYDPGTLDRDIASFSSSGPTVEGRTKPEILAPGEGILTARSTPESAFPGSAAPVEKTGTSFAAPHVTGAVALLFEAVAPRKLSIAETRKILLSNTDEAKDQDPLRAGMGYLNVNKVLEAVRRFVTEGQTSIEETRQDPEEAPEQSKQQIAVAEIGLDAEDTLADSTDTASQTASEKLDSEITTIRETDMNEERESLVDMSEVPTYADEQTGAFELYDNWSEADEDFGNGVATFDSFDFDEDVFFEPETLAAYETNIGAQLVEFANQAVITGKATSSGALLEQVLWEAGVNGDLNPPGSEGKASLPAVLFEAFSPWGRLSLRRLYEQFFEVVASPGEKLQKPTQPGDLLIRSFMGEGAAHLAILAEGQTFQMDKLTAAGLQPEGNRPGLYAQVVEVGAFPHTLEARFARRIGESDNRLGQNTLLLRSRASSSPMLIEQQRRSQPRPQQQRPQRGRVTNQTFVFDGDLILQIGQKGTPLAAGQDEVKNEINELAKAINGFWSNFLTGLANFETTLEFASDQETRPRSFDLALRTALREAFNFALLPLRAFPVTASIARATIGSVNAVLDELNTTRGARGERRIAEYITNLRRLADVNGNLRKRFDNLAGREQRMRLLAAFQDALKTTSVENSSQDMTRLIAGPAAVFIVRLRAAVKNFKESIPSQDRFQQLFTEQFAVRPSGRRTTRDRAAGRLYIKVNLNFDNQDDIPSWRIDNIEPEWTLVTLAPNPPRLAQSLEDSLKAQDQEVWRTNLTKVVQFEIEVEGPGINRTREGLLFFMNDPDNVNIRFRPLFPTSRDPLFRNAWRFLRTSRRILGVDELRGSDR